MKGEEGPRHNNLPLDKIKSLRTVGEAVLRLPPSPPPAHLEASGKAHPRSSVGAGRPPLPACDRL